MPTLVAAAFAVLSTRGAADALEFFDDRAETLDLPKPQVNDLRQAITTRARLL